MSPLDRLPAVAGALTGIASGATVFGISWSRLAAEAFTRDELSARLTFASLAIGAFIGAAVAFAIESRRHG